MSVEIAPNDFIEHFGRTAGPAVPGQRGVDSSEYIYDLESGRLAPLPKPSPASTFSTFSPQLRIAVFTASDDTGTHLWRSKPSSGTTLVLETNTFVREIAAPEWKKFVYRGTDGKELIG
jgi:hypothetical protein